MTIEAELKNALANPVKKKAPLQAKPSVVVSGWPKNGQRHKVYLDGALTYFVYLNKEGRVDFVLDMDGQRVVNEL